MNRDPRLERYLSTLENALKPFPVSDRAEIITEIKSHVLSALERDPQASVDGILAALGEPEIVANRYLLERGLKPGKPPISPIVRWLVIGFLGTVAMLLAFAVFLVANFSPIVRVDEKGQTVEILGGAIKVDGDKDRVSIRGIIDTDMGSYSGSQTLDAGETVSVKFSNGRMEIEANEEPSLEWECRGGGGSSPQPLSEGGTTTLDFSSMLGVKCDIRVPKGAKLDIKGTNGRVSISEADFDVTADLARGSVEFGAAKDVAFKFDVKVDMGKTDAFESSDKPGARSAKIHVGSGRISKED